MRQPEAILAEAISLTKAIDLKVLHSAVVPMREIKAGTYLGKGTIDSYRDFIKENEVAVVILSCHLSPLQQRNLEKEWNTKVIDKTALILEIFGKRARTREGVLQVELAHLTYARSRLVRSWTHLERQRGGSGFLGGPGETQIELDRRLIDEDIVKIKKELAEVKKTRELHRKARRRVPFP
ncbi:MAG: GTPase HflX, partial [Alphaproteobacteria bacterium]|nr:GTPase HflX [Alphaproteobacteria bacterium]